MHKVSDQDISDEILIKRIAALDEDAFMKIYDRYAQRMLRYFYRMLYQDEELAQDFVQDLFLKLVEKADSFNPKQKFSTWIYTLAANMCKNEYRKRKVRDRFKQEAFYKENIAESGIEDFLDRESFSKELSEALEILSPEQRSVFVLRYQEDLSLKEISVISQCAEGTVKSRIYYGLKKLAQKLAAYRSHE